MKNDTFTANTAKERSGATYNLKAVVQRTGLKPDTLRAWERRYGLPNPQRTAGGHRLYSQRDIQILQWLINRQDNGLSISRAVNLWHQLEAKEIDPLQELPIETSPDVAPPVPKGSNIANMRDAWIESCAQFDERSANNIVSQALSMYPVETVCFEIFQHGLSNIGAQWYEGKMSAQQEHFASALAIRRLDSMVAGSPLPTKTGRILIGCAAEDEHTFPALLLTLLLRRRGWDIVYLGANVPVELLSSTLQAAKPKLVILTAQTLWTAATLFEMAELLAEEEVPLAFGGLVFSSNEQLRTRIPGHYLGSTLPEATANVEQLVGVSRPYENVSYGSAETQAALQHFLDRQAKLESVVWELMAGIELKSGHLARANRDLSRSIIAALTLGDLNYILPDMEWVKGILMNYHYRIPDNILNAYMAAYEQAAQQTLDERGQLIIAWLAKIVE